MLERLPFLSSGVSLRPALACEISSQGVLAARQDPASGMLSQFALLPDGALHATTRGVNIQNRPVVVEALRTALSGVVERGRNLPGGRNMQGNRALTLIVPDGVARVLLLDFDSLPSKRSEALPLLRFRLRKLVPFDMEDAAITYQVMSSSAGQVRVLAIAMPHAVLMEYESAVREAGFLPGVVLPSTVAAMPLLGATPSLLVNRNGNTLTTAIVRGHELLLHRTLDFSITEDPEGLRLPRSIEERELAETDDVRQSVSVAMAYYEDSLAAPVNEVFYIGPDSATEFSALLGESSIPVVDLAPEPALPSRTLPRSLLAPVAGALLNA